METRDKIMSGIEYGIIHILDKGIFAFETPISLEEIARETLLPMELVQKGMTKLEKKGYLSMDAQGNYFIPKI
ncbi:MAG: hypothetical protein WC852_04375 [Candidatus Nanoarchaeia archaeon]|jgi:DNA-binding IclR family transcriptional regulator